MTSNVSLRQSSVVQIFLVFLLAIVDITPHLSRSLDPRVSFGIFFLWVISAAMSTGFSSVFKDKDRVAHWWLILIGWQIFLSLIGFSTRPPGFFIHRASVYLMPIIGVYCVRYFNKKELRLLFILLLLVLAYNLVDNVVLGSGGNNYFEEYGYKDEDFLASNAGKSGFVNAMMYLTGLMVLLLLSTNKKSTKLISLVIAILSLVYVTFINSRTTATMLLILMIIGLIYFNRTKKELESRRVIGLFVTIAVLFFLLMPFWDSIISLLPNRSVERLTSLPDALNGNISYSDYIQGDSFSVRIYLASVSIKTWLSGPITFIIGKGEDAAAGLSIYDLTTLGIGQHSQIIDFLAMYGVFGLFLLYKAFSASYKFIIKQGNSQKMSLMVKTILFVFLLASVLNNSIFPGEMFLLTIMLPILIVLLKKTDVNINKKGYVSKTL